MQTRVVELFAGVGGFHLGLVAAGGFEVVWANQWEPDAKAQHAFTVLEKRFPTTPKSNQDIHVVHEQDIPVHDLLAAGLPCQDYSVAKPNTDGIDGDKGALWFDVDRIVRYHRPRSLLFENVDRLLKSPGSDKYRGDRRGRDFGVMLATLMDLGYAVEWRVVNAAEYGGAQRRRRLFFTCFRQDTPAGQKMAQGIEMPGYLARDGFFAQAFPCVAAGKMLRGRLNPNLDEMQKSFRFLFENSGVMAHGQFVTMRVDAAGNVKPKTLGERLQPSAGESYYIPEERLPAWRYRKGSKDEQRTTKAGHTFHMNEGAVEFPDPLDRPSRTITKNGEGGTSADRSKHAVCDPETGRLRVLTPLECERLQGFPDDWTSCVPESWRYKLMGNALVVDVVATIGKHLPTWLNLERAEIIPVRVTRQLDLITIQ